MNSYSWRFDFVPNSIRSLQNKIFLRHKRLKIFLLKMAPSVTVSLDTNARLAALRAAAASNAVLGEEILGETEVPGKLTALAEALGKKSDRRACSTH